MLCIFSGSSCHLHFKASPACPTCAEHVPAGQAVVQLQALPSPLWHVAGARGTSHPSQALFPAWDSVGSPSPRAEPGTVVALASSELQPPPSPAGRGRNQIQWQQMQFPRMDVHFHYTYTLSNWW